ncbi:MAG: hypothetical protein NC226_09250 [Bacteroides cellulosilyticus]|nr:hypothetical protein [Bacteroides cellulosilyticus]
MRRIAWILSVAAVVGALLAGCCPCRHLTTGTRDSIRVETVIRTERVPDTVLLEVPIEVIRQTVRDTTSHLETSFALSDAWINPDGSLFHSLENKAQKRPVATEKEIEHHETKEYRGHEETEIVEVPRPLTWWQQTQIRACWVLLALLLVVYRKQIAAVIKKLL